MSRSLELLTDACEGLVFRVQKMFGGHGFFAPNGGMFAGILSDDAVIFKLEAGPAREELISLGGHAWEYSGPKGNVTMSMWIVIPDSFYDDSELLGSWAKRAHELAPAKLAKVKGAKKVAKPVAPKKKAAKVKTKARKSRR